MTTKIQLRRAIDGGMEDVNPMTSEECVMLEDGKKLKEVIDFVTTTEDFVDEDIVVEENLVDRVESIENRIGSEFEQQNSQIATGLSNIKTIEQNINNKVDSEVAKVNAQLSKIENIKANVNDVDSKIWNMRNMGQDVKEAMTGGSVAVVGDDAVLTRNIVDKQVTIEKTSFAKRGINKFNGVYVKGSSIAAGKYDDVTFQNAYSIVFEAEKTKTYTISWSKDSDRFGIVTYNSKPINGQSYLRIINDATAVGVDSKTFQLQADENYIQVIVSSNSANKTPSWVQVEEGSYATPFVGYDNVAFNIDLVGSEINDKLGLSYNANYNRMLLEQQFGEVQKSVTEKIEVTTDSSSGYVLDVIQDGVDGDVFYAVVTTNDMTGKYANLISIRQYTGTSNAKRIYSKYIGNGMYFVEYEFEKIDNTKLQFFLDNRSGNEKIIVKSYYVCKNGLINKATNNVMLNSTLYVSPVGNDGNSGTSVDKPLASFQKAINLGAKKIFAVAGNYRNQTMRVFDREELEIKVINATVDVKNEKPMARLINSLDVDVTLDLDSGLYTSQVVLPQTHSFYKVFISQELPVIRTGLQSESYNAILWETDNIDLTKNTKLKPVLTLDEVKISVGTFYYDGTKLYINPKFGTIENKKFKRLAIEDDESAISFLKVNKVTMEDIAFDYYSHSANFDLCNDITIKHCETTHSAYNTGLKFYRSNAEVHDCKSYKNTADGFGISGYGSCNFYDCKGFYNYDDGISHHDGCTGVIIGGEYNNNVKGGVTPAYGSKVDCHNVISHNNVRYGFYYVSADPAKLGVECNMVNCVEYGNGQAGLRVDNYKIKTFNCKFSSTSKLDNADTNLIEL